MLQSWPDFKGFLKHKKQYNHAYHYEVTTKKKTWLNVQFLTGILLISAELKICKQYFLIKQLYEIGPRVYHIENNHSMAISLQNGEMII